MNTRALLKQDVLSNQSVTRVGQSLCAVVAAFVMIAGIMRLPEMELTETGVYFGSMGIMAFAGIFPHVRQINATSAAPRCPQ